jgi:hypothetical protein
MVTSARNEPEEAGPGEKEYPQITQIREFMC